MNRISTVLSILFGYMFLALSALVSLETILRKVFNTSLQGADELGGYALAVGSSLAFSIALIGRSHIRIELLHQRFPLMVRALLNWAAIMTLAGFGVLLAWFGFRTIDETLLYGSTSHTAWLTPQIYPQGAWYAALLIFSLLTVVLAVRATYLLFSKRIDDLDRDFHPKGAMEELKEEIADATQR